MHKGVNLWKISSNFESEVTIIKQKYLSAGYSEKFVNSTIKCFREKLNDKSRCENFFDDADNTPVFIRNLQEDNVC